MRKRKTKKGYENEGKSDRKREQRNEKREREKEKNVLSYFTLQWESH